MAPDIFNLRRRPHQLRGMGGAEVEKMYQRPSPNPNPNPNSCSSSSSGSLSGGGSGSGSNSSSPDSPKSPLRRDEVLRDLKRQALLRDLSRQLAHGDRASRIQAARDIRKLARASVKARSAFAVDAVVGPLVAMLPSPEREERESALLALLNLAVRNERNKVVIVESGAVPPLVELLKSESSGLRELAAAAVLTLSAAESNKSTITSSGAAPLLVQILISGSIQGKVDAVTALYNLSSCKESLDPSLYVDAVAPLLALLKESKKYSKFAEKASSLLEILSGTHEGRSAISEVEGGILTVVETVEDGSYPSMEYAAGVLLSLCQSCREKYRELILKEGAIPGLLRLTVYGTKKGQERARELLELLRDDSRQKRATSEVLETIAYDIASRVDGPVQAVETAKKLLKDMMRRKMEVSVSRLHVKAVSCPTAVP
uniref:U-box domain-containing protein 3 n=1 Tax=Anthurium amnicola TaxID=1678845 RepID=A0A1D1XR58_9ARAE